MNDLRNKKVLTVLFAALSGGAYWAGVRPSGYGVGPSLGLLWGFYWLLLVYYIRPDSRFPPKSMFIMFAFIIGLSLGGTQGYGQFNLWMRGRFFFNYSEDPNTFIAISPVYGYIHLLVCGLTWGGFLALFLAWFLTGKNNWKTWITRAILAGAGYWGMQLFIILVPRLFLPFYNAGYYADLGTCPTCICPDCQRTIDTARNTWGYFGIFIVLSLYTMLRNKDSWRIILPISLGFALTFSNGGFLHMGLVGPFSLLPWWKFWEFTCGFGGGLTIFSTFWHIEKHGILDKHINTRDESKPRSYLSCFWITFYLAAGELGRDRFQQAAKIWYNIFSLDLKLLFMIFGFIIIGMAAILFLIRFIKCLKQDAGLECKHLYIKKPTGTFLFILIAYFILAQLAWIRGADLFTYIIPILNISALVIALFIFTKIKRRQ